jgi:YidC/Oxa1 family membrane protein insertase
MTDSTVVLSGRVLEGTPFLRFITEPIARLFGWIINILFSGVYAVSANPVNTLGIAIVLMTIIFRFLIMPLGLKSQRSMMKMREIQPELKKLKEKYGNTRDPEIMRKMQQEQSALMAKHGANPLSGCLPMLIQMPLFIGLNEVMRRSSFYISSLRNMYEDLAEKLLQIPGLIGIHTEGDVVTHGVIEHLAYGTSTLGAGPIVPPNWGDNLRELGTWLYNQGLFYEHTVEQLRAGIDHVGGNIIVLGLPDHLAQVINRFTVYDWEYVRAAVPVDYYHLWAGIQNSVDSLSAVETFLGISMVSAPGWGWHGVLIPIITGISMFCSSWIMQQRTYDPNAENTAKTMQKVMLFGMPLFMAFITASLVAAVGIFWTVGQVFQVIQDIILMKKSGQKIRLPFMKSFTK